MSVVSHPLSIFNKNGLKTKMAQCNKSIEPF
jgi:hypothetical protein